jgi:outer membrane protein insertion porin family
MRQNGTFFLLLIAIFITQTAEAQTDTIPVKDTILQSTKDTIPQSFKDTVPGVSVDPELMGILDAKIPKKYIIQDIKVTGARVFDPAIVISVSGLAVGEEITLPGGDQFAKAINRLWTQNMFTNINIFITKLEGRNIWVELVATERPMLSDFHFKGVKKTEADELKDKVAVFQNRVVTDNMKLTSIENIRKYFVEKGFREVEVTINEIQDTTEQGKVIFDFIVDKGSKVKIDEIHFFGQENISEQKLKAQLKGTKEMSKFTLFPAPVNSAYGEIKRITFKEYVKDWGFLSPSKTRDYLDPWFRFKMFANAKFNEKKYSEDKEKVIGYMNSQGYRDAQIIADTQYANGKGNLNVELKVDEGSKYYFGNITWKGNTKYSDSILTLILGIKKGDVYNLDVLNKKIGKELTQEGGDISSLYMDDGYLFFQIEPIETAVYNDTIDHEIRLREGPQATIKNVNIAGNEKTKEYVIRRELRTVPGDKFSRSELIRSQREIVNLGYFNQEKLGLQPVPNQEDGTVDINYTVEEKSSDQLELSAGWGGGIGLTGTLGVTFNNFSLRNIFKSETWDPLPSGDGQKLSLRFQSNGRYYRSINFSFTEPWLGGKKRNSLTVSVYNNKFSNAYNPATGAFDKRFSDSSYLKTTGFTVALGKQLKWPDDFFTLVYSLSFINYNARNYPIFPGFSNGKSTNVNFKIALNRSSIDQPIFPRSGSNFLLSAAFTPPWSAMRGINEADIFRLIEFQKYRFNAEWFVPIGKPTGTDKSRQFVLRVALKYGFLGRYNPKLPISPFERFQVGDAGLTNNFGVLGYDIIAHRGYPVYEFSDPNINPDISQATRFFTIFNKYTVELRYPLVTNPSSTIYGLAFFEAANGWYSFKDYNPFRLRRSVGLGMRFFLPMFGLLGFDYGVGLDRITNGSRLKDASKFTFMLGFEPE